MFKIINIYSIFQNPYNDWPWRVMRGTDFIKSFRTRADARAFIKALKQNDTSTELFDVSETESE